MFFSTSKVYFHKILLRENRLSLLNDITIYSVDHDGSSSTIIMYEIPFKILLRQEVKTLREGGNGNRERLTVEWLTQSIAEMRKELTELQEIASNASKDLNRRSQTFEDLATIRNDFKTVKLELEALKHRQEKSEVFVRELREEALQTEDDIRKILRNFDKSNSATTTNGDYPAPEADHRMRHQRLLRQQVHDIEISQRSIKHQLAEMQYHRIGERIQNLEVEQRRLANANFNLSRQVATLDKLHGSMLELLEDVEGIQAKVDKSIPDMKREFSKLEFTSAQLNSEQSLLREEQHNAAKSLQAMAVSVSMLQDQRVNLKDMQNIIDKLREDVKRLQVATDAHKSMLHGRIEKIESEATSRPILSEEETYASQATNLIHQLESVETQYESIVNKLPSDCGQVNHTAAGLYLIAPAGQHRPTLAHCSSGWTAVQRRFDGSVDFNRSWEAYAQGFGSPSGEFWIGNDILHHLTADNCTRLKIIMQDIYDNTWYALYDYFYVSSREDGYRLHVGGYSGNASDALDYQNRMQFSAIDVDRDISNTHCAANYEGGWWFSHCQHANLNGRYNLGLTWFDAARNEWIAVKSSQIMVNRKASCASVTSPSQSDRSLTTDSITTTIATVV
ncbi:unnamed protein product [Hermetia illucens]|uniref:Fibrinogen C-terminal domain-containing protein n=1 Tax=Hermetia illucens TaxID=343691 RepID=A0A7R8YM14_HERIL|nr:unnamed protein product [Hermetia illucens]